MSTQSEADEEPAAANPRDGCVAIGASPSPRYNTSELRPDWLQTYRSLLKVHSGPFQTAPRLRACAVAINSRWTRVHPHLSPRTRHCCPPSPAIADVKVNSHRRLASCGSKSVARGRRSAFWRSRLLLATVLDATAQGRNAELTGSCLRLYLRFEHRNAISINAATKRSRPKEWDKSPREAGQTDAPSDYFCRPLCEARACMTLLLPLRIAVGDIPLEWISPSSVLAFCRLHPRLVLVT